MHKRRKALGIKAYRKHAYRENKRRNNKGYIVVTLKPGDPMTAMARTSRQVMEHRLVMAQHLGRPLTIDEFVHHRNGMRDDNRIENLELWTRSHPDGQRVQDKLEWARDFITRYENEFAATPDFKVAA